VKVALLNQHTDNFGDDLATLAHCDRLAKGVPALELELVYAPYEWGSEVPLKDVNVSHSKSLRDFRPRRRDLLPFVSLGSPTVSRHAARRVLPGDLVDVLERSDEVVISPCGAAIGMHRSIPSLVCAAAAVAYGHRPTFALNTVGPSGDRLFDRVALEVFKRSSMFVRERASFDYLIHHGIPSTLGVDSAFALGPLGPADVPRGPRPIVYVPADMALHPRFYRPSCSAAELYSMVARALASNTALDEHPIHLLPHVHGCLTVEREQVFEEASRAFRANGIADERLVLRDDVSDALGYAEALGAALFVVAMRYHGCVGAAMAGVPFITLAYENKMLEVAHHCDLDDLALRNDQLSLAVLERLIARVVRSPDRYGNKIAQRRGRLRELASGPPNSIIIRNWGTPE
jgi:polysaccharide pyruvyl transferase WcaK-like protein